jgi:hypothetical protein
MGMMDGGFNFRDICHKCDASEQGGSMKRYIHDRNKKICNECLNKLDDEGNREEFNSYVYASQLKRGLFND